MNDKFYVSLEAEELLIEKGYPIEKAEQIYNERRDVIGCYPADRPTKAEAIDWLESKGIYISIYYKIDRYNYNVEYKNEHFRIEVCGIGETRLEAEDAAIIKALELIDYEKRKSNL